MYLLKFWYNMFLKTVYTKSHFFVNEGWKKVVVFKTGNSSKKVKCEFLWRLVAKFKASLLFDSKNWNNKVVSDLVSTYVYIDWNCSKMDHCAVQ